MSQLFSDAELRLLKWGDRALSGPGRGHRNHRHVGSLEGGIGTLTREQAVALHEQGMSAREIAEAAGVTANHVSFWRRKLGLTRHYHKAKKKGRA